MKKEQKILLDFRWTDGLGSSLIRESLCAEISWKRNVEIISPSKYNSQMLRLLLRLIYLLRPHFLKADVLVVFSDIPIWVFGCRQVVYFHNLDLLKRKSLKNSFLLHLMKMRHSKYVVQTNVVKNEVMSVLGKDLELLVHCPPSRINFQHKQRRKDIPTFIYPARNYPHKNIEWLKNKWNDDWGILKLTVDGVASRGVLCLGELNDAHYDKALMDSNCCLIVSSYESLCLPIIESKNIGMPLIVPRTSYATALLEEKEAYWFTLFDDESLGEAIYQFSEDLLANKVRIPFRVESNWLSLLEELSIGTQR